jgi:uncharacterized protein YbjT (DUF2867 family)
MVLVTGVTGRSGASVIREFARQGEPVRGLVRGRAKAQAMRLDNLPAVELVEGDMLRPASLHAAFEGVTRVLTISGARRQMVETQCAFIDAAKAAGVPHVVKFSGAESGVGFDAQAFSGTRQHEEVERYLRVSGISWTILRPSQFMQTYLFEPLSVGRHQALIRPMGAARLSPIDIEDIAKILEEIYAERRKHLDSRVELGADEAFGVRPTSFAEFAARNVAAFRRAPEGRRGDRPGRRHDGGAARWPGRRRTGLPAGLLLHGELPEHGDRRPGTDRRLWHDVQTGHRHPNDRN